LASKTLIGIKCASNVLGSWNTLINDDLNIVVFSDLNLSLAPVMFLFNKIVSARLDIKVAT